MIAALCLTSWSILAVASDEAGAEGALRGFLTDVASMTAGFEQKLYDPSGHSMQESRGRFYIRRPGKFRWEYDDPEQLVVSDGSRLWMYDYDLEQVTVRKVDDSLGGTPAMLLSGQGRIDESFDIGAAYEEEGLEWIELLPLGDSPEFKALRVGMNETTVVALEIRDSLDQVTRIDFHDLELGPELPDSLFQFAPPEGVDVIGEGVDF